MGLRSVIGVAVAALLPGSALASEVIATCGSDSIVDQTSTLASDVGSVIRFADAGRFASSELDAFSGDGPSYSGQGTDQSPQQFEYDRKQASEADPGNTGSVPTVAWNADEQAQIQAVEKTIPPCVISKSGVGQQYRVQRGLPYAQSHILGAAFSYNNRDNNGHRVVLTDLMFNKAALDHTMNADQQMQMALGWASCFPPTAASQNWTPAQKLAAVPPEIKSLTVREILYHEFLHGVTHSQEGDERNNPASYEYFLSHVSRYAQLNTALNTDGGSLNKQANELRSAITGPRDQLCAARKKYTDFLAANGVPARWPGDDHSMEDPNEYAVIFIENAIFNPSTTFGPGSPYSAAEQQWVKDWWQHTFGAPLGQCGNTNVAKGPSTSGKPGSMQAYGSLNNRTSWFSGF